MTLLDDIIGRIQDMAPEERAQAEKIARQATGHLEWCPNPGPQTDALNCEADELFYGGQAGGGKTDLLLGTALTQHKRSLILRRMNTEVPGLVERMKEIVGHNRGLKNSPPIIWRLLDPMRLVMFGGCQHLNDRVKYQGVPKDFIGFDEIPNFLEAQYLFIIAWARSTVPGQRVRVIAAGNPPTTPEGMWVNQRWGAWLDPNHPNPALPGELRWYTTYEGRDTEVDGPGPVVIDGTPLLDDRGNAVYPKSRTFIPAELADNPDLAETGYAATLAALPQELRDAMYRGDFTPGQIDEQWQVIPSAWVDAAMLRWSEDGAKQKMTGLGVDIAQGGRDRTVLARKHGSWFDRLIVEKGADTPDGPVVAGLIIKHMRDNCAVIIDMGGGYGGSTIAHLGQLFSPQRYNGSSEGIGVDRSGKLKFFNKRAEAMWRFREALDPEYGSGIALPPDPELKADLCGLKWILRTGKVLIESKEDFRDRTGRSPDRGDAVIMAHYCKAETNLPGKLMGSGLPTHANSSGRAKPRRF